MTPTLIHPTIKFELVIKSQIKKMQVGEPKYYVCKPF
jgi:hypothetical protein